MKPVIVNSLFALSFPIFAYAASPTSVTTTVKGNSQQTQAAVAQSHSVQARPASQSTTWKTQNAQNSQPSAKPASDNPNHPTPPLNQYGAVDVNANVPANVQVPPAPADFKPPVLNSEINEWPNLLPSQPILNAKSYLLMDANSGRVLLAYNANQRVAPASLTKLMLLYIAEKALKSGQIHLSDKVTVPRVAWATGGSRMFLRPGMQVTVQQLIDGIIVDSGNDAAVTLATYIAGTQAAFTSLMNHEAKALGMTNTHFTDVMGLPAPYHYSSARDMAILARAIVTKFPQYLGWYDQKSFKFNGIKQYNFNKLLFIYQYADGLKTGSTDAAGYSLISTAKMPNRQLRLVGVVMGAPNPMASATQSKALLSFGFRFFKTQLMYTQGEIIKKIRVYMGKNKDVGVTVAQDLYATYPNNPGQKLAASLNIDKDIQAPITKGQKLGMVVIKLNGKVVNQAPVIAAEANPKGNFWRRMSDKVSSWF